MISEKKFEEEVESEAKHILKIIWSIIKYPFTLLLVLFGKKEPSELSAPIKHLWKFFWDAKLTAWLIALNILIFVVFAIMGFPSWVENYFVFYPKNFFSISIIGSGFMHGSWTHLIGNVLFLFVLGRVVEKKIGAGKAAFVYFISMIIGCPRFLLYTGRTIPFSV